MTDSEIRNAAALDHAADEAARAWVLTDEAVEPFPGLGNQLLQRVDVYRGAWRMAPVVAVNGQAVPDMGRSFECFADDVRELPLGSVA